MVQNKKSKKEIEKEKQRKKTIIICSIGAFFILALIALLIIVLITQSGGEQKDSSSQASSQMSVTDTALNSEASASGQSIPDADISDVIDTSKTYFADINIKDYGKITVELNYDAAPRTVKNFVSLAQAKFYNGLTFHRIIDGFMMQGGDPLGNGTGGSETNLYGEFSENGYTDNTLSHKKGAISMARATDYNSASSQFFIVQDDSAASTLDGKYACFGYVTDGLELVDKICKDAQPTDNNGTISKEQQPVIESITIRTEDKA